MIKCRFCENSLKKKKHKYSLVSDSIKNYYCEPCDIFFEISKDGDFDGLVNYINVNDNEFVVFFILKEWDKKLHYTKYNLTISHTNNFKNKNNINIFKDVYTENDLSINKFDKNKYIKIVNKYLLLYNIS